MTNTPKLSVTINQVANLTALCEEFTEDKLVSRWETRRKYTRETCHVLRDQCSIVVIQANLEVLLSSETVSVFYRFAYQPDICGLQYSAVQLLAVYNSSTPHPGRSLLT